MRQPEGVIFDLQRYAIHDGPGIRTTIYFKGCPLVCDWCHNPEGQDPDAQLLIDPSRCIRCGACAQVCPEGLAAPAPGGVGDEAAASDGAAADGRGDEPTAGRCRRCGRCAEACPAQARRMAGRWVSAERLVDEIERDRPFFESSGGGVTFSGGEPLLQATFLLATLAECRRRGLHRVVDTCGYAPPATLSAVAEETDLFLFDLKTIDPQRHRAHTGVALEPILANLRLLDDRGAVVWIRTPLIAGFNDTPEQIEAMGRLVASLNQVRRIHLLPYHRGAEAKLARLGRAPGPTPYATPHLEELEGARRRLERLGLEAIAGG